MRATVAGRIPIEAREPALGGARARRGRQLDPERRYDSVRFVRSDRDSVASISTSGSRRRALPARGRSRSRASVAPPRGRGRQRLEQAEAAYAGDFLDEDRYQDWAIGLRAGVSSDVCRSRARARQGLRRRGRRRFFAVSPSHPYADAYDERAHLRLGHLLSKRLGVTARRDAHTVYTLNRMVRSGKFAPAAFPTAHPPP